MMHFKNLDAKLDGSGVFNDAVRILIDNVYIHDFLRNLHLTPIYLNTIDYYGQYLLLSMDYRPSFFAFIEAIFSSLFGIECWNSHRLALLACYHPYDMEITE